MKNPRIARMLKYYRKLNNLSVTNVSEILKKYNVLVADKTIYGWESGHTHPNADTFMLLCEIYNIDDVLEAFGYRSKPKTQLMLSKEEEVLIIRYREYPQMHAAIKKILDL